LADGRSGVEIIRHELKEERAMPRAKSQKDSKPFVVDENTMRLFVLVRYAGISPMAAQVDGLRRYYFGDARAAYLEIDSAIRFHKSELSESGGRSGSQAMVDELTKAKRLLKEGKADCDRDCIINIGLGSKN
jgi:hypothetical protein